MPADKEKSNFTKLSLASRNSMSATCKNCRTVDTFKLSLITCGITADLDFRRAKIFRRLLGCFNFPFKKSQRKERSARNVLRKDRTHIKRSSNVSKRGLYQVRRNCWSCHERDYHRDRQLW
jgi:hypothetical protein